MSFAYENFPITNIHIGRQSDISMEAVAAPLSEITQISSTTFNSQTPFMRALRQNQVELYRASSRRSPSRRTATVSLNTGGFINPRNGPLSQSLKDRGKFVWELCKLNYRMLISLTLTLSVAIFVTTPLL